MVTLVSRKSEKRQGFEWDRLIWILYNREYVIQEAWQFDAEEYGRLFADKKRLSPKDLRQSVALYRVPAGVQDLVA